MALYLGQISIDIAFSTHAQFVNFKPLYEFKDNKFYKLSEDDLQCLLPESESRKICFYKYHSISDEFTEKELVLLDFETSELESNFSYNNVRAKVGYKINLEKKESVKHLGDFRYYYVVKKEHIEGDFRKDPSLIITDPSVYPGMTIMFPIDDNPKFLLGPFKVFYSDENEVIIKLNHDRQTRIMSGIHFQNDYQSYYTKFVTDDGICSYLNVNEGNLEKEYIDVADEETLFKNFINIINDDTFSSSKTDIEKIETLLKEKSIRLFVDNNIPQSIRNSRKEKLINIFTDKNSLENSFNLLSKNIDNFLINNKDTDNYQQILTDLVNNTDFMQKSQNFKIIDEKIKQREENLNELNIKCKNMKSELKFYTKQTTEAILNAKNEELNSINCQIDNAKRDYNTISKELESLREEKSLNEQLESLKKDIAYNEKRNKDLEENTDKLSKIIDDIFEKKTEKAINLTFDGMLSSKLIQQAGKWETEQRSLSYKDFVKNEKQYKVSEKKSEDLIKYIISKVKKQRPNYDDNFIINILICITQGFITFFSGEPGGGKTSICKILAKAMGLTSISNLNYDSDISPNRFLNISVERGWTNKRDFIGYYNPLTKEFDYSNRQIFDCLNILNIEKKNNQTNLPYIILLDEANLSPMEYYWADFMNICDDLDDNSCINLGSDYSFKIPRNLRFLATINNDHTTEALSPRLIDRSWIIRMPKRNNITLLSDREDNEKDFELISWNALEEVFLPADYELSDYEVYETAKDIYKEILGKLTDAGISISTRTEIAVRKYWIVAQRLFTKDKYETDPTIIALDYALAQRILPHINGSGEEFGNSLQQLKETCVKHNLRISANVLEDIITKGNNSMSYYQYFA